MCDMSRSSVLIVLSPFALHDMCAAASKTRQTIPKYTDLCNFIFNPFDDFFPVQNTFIPFNVKTSLLKSTNHPINKKLFIRFEPDGILGIV